MQQTAYTDIFLDYFEQSFWGNKDGSSGPNSAYDETPLLRENLQRLLEELNIQTLFDAGCGDANLFHFLNINFLESYIGAECVESLSRQNQQQFSDRVNMSFVTQDIVEDDMPKVDLILCRDVVHYLPNDLVQKFLENCLQSGSKYLLITHNTHSPDSANSPTQAGIFRPVNLTQTPFNYPAPIQTIKEDVFAKELALYKIECF